MPKLNLRNNGVCTIASCLTPNRGRGTARGYCHTHYERWRRRGQPEKLFNKWSMNSYEAIGKHPLAATYRGMLQRCYNKNAKSYRTYGARGIVVCERWRQDFKLFVKDMGEKPTSRHTMDRINNNGNYEPGNVRWATPEQQGLNKSVNVKVMYGGKKITITELKKLLSIPHSTIWAWHYKGQLQDKTGATYE